MKIEIKFDIDDRIYYLTQQEDHKCTTCSKCNGAKTFKLEGLDEFVECSLCCGKGKLEEHHYIMVPEEGTISGFAIYCNSEDDGEVHTSYFIKETCDDHDEEFIFYSKELAQQECDKLNSNPDEE